jgi:hypothetical protein
LNLTIVYRDAVNVRLEAVRQLQAVSPVPMEVEKKWPYVVQKSYANQAIHSAMNSEHAVELSGPKGDNPATGGSAPTRVQHNTHENDSGESNFRTGKCVRNSGNHRREIDGNTFS